jgi:hypothetical protein
MTLSVRVKPQFETPTPRSLAHPDVVYSKRVFLETARGIADWAGRE